MDNSILCDVPPITVKVKLSNLFQIEGQRMAEQYVARSRGSKICLHLEAASFHLQAGLCLWFSNCYVSLRSGVEIFTKSHLPISRDYLMGQLTILVGLCIVQWLPTHVTCLVHFNVCTCQLLHNKSKARKEMKRSDGVICHCIVDCL